VIPVVGLAFVGLSSGTLAWLSQLSTVATPLVIGGIEAFLELPGVAQTPAGENRAILAYPEGDFLTFGPRIADSLRLLIEDLAVLQS